MKPTDHDQNLLAEAYAKIGDTEYQTSKDLAEKLKEYLSSGATYASFLYSPKDGGQFKYVINMNVDYSRLRANDLERLKAYDAKDDAYSQAKEELVASMEQHATKGVSDSYVHKDTYEFLGKGVKIHKETGIIHVNGFVQHREVIVPAPAKKPVVSRNEVTAAKKDIKETLDFESDKIREFKLDPQSIGGLRLKGDLIEFHE